VACTADCPFCAPAPAPTQDARAIAALRRDLAVTRELLHASLDASARLLDELAKTKHQLAEARADLARYTRDIVAPGRGPALSSAVDSAVTGA
jgi:septal ring factor EnvC (AmiA/AmiB activator)